MARLAGAMLAALPVCWAEVESVVEAEVDVASEAAVLVAVLLLLKWLEPAGGVEVLDIV